jgi:hypothetical protein
MPSQVTYQTKDIFHFGTGKYVLESASEERLLFEREKGSIMYMENDEPGCFEIWKKIDDTNEKVFLFEDTPKEELDILDEEYREKKRNSFLKWDPFRMGERTFM